MHKGEDTAVSARRGSWAALSPGGGGSHFHGTITAATWGTPKGRRMLCKNKDPLGPAVEAVVVEVIRACGSAGSLG